MRSQGQHSPHVPAKAPSPAQRGPFWWGEHCIAALLSTWRPVFSEKLPRVLHLEVWDFIVLTVLSVFSSCSAVHFPPRAKRTAWRHGYGHGSQPAAKREIPGPSTSSLLTQGKAAALSGAGHGCPCYSGLLCFSLQNSQPFPYSSSRSGSHRIGVSSKDP